MIDVTFKLPEAGAMMKKLGLDQRGEVQKAIAKEALIQCEPLVPIDTGILKQSGHIENDGELIVWNQPYAKFQYYGMLMVDEVTESPWSKKDGKKKLTDTPLKYHGQGESHWFDKAMQNGGPARRCESAVHDSSRSDCEMAQGSQDK